MPHDDTTLHYSTNFYMKMKKVFILIAMLAIVSCGTSRKVRKDAASDSIIRVGTYNLWKSTIGKGDYAWEVRKHRLAKSVAELDFDVFGVQELDYPIQDEFPGLLARHGASEYVWYTFSPYSQDGTGDKAQAILFRKDRFELVEGHSFWLSPTPEIMSHGWDEQKYLRGACCVILKDIRTGKRIFVMNSHFPLGKEAKCRAADVVISMEKKYNPEGLPSFLIGDLNNRPGTPGSQMLRTHWTDSFLFLPDDKKEGSKGTFNGHDVGRDMEKSQRIDYVYFRNSAVPLKYHCSNKKYDGFWPSDHCAVYVDMKIN